MTEGSTAKTRAPRDPERRKREIVQAAAELIAQEGGRHLTHRRVADRAGVPLGSTTRYFKSIDDLRRAGLAFLAEEIDRRNRDMLGQVCADKPAAEALSDFAVAYFRDADQIRADAMFYAASIADPEVGGLWRRVFQESAQDYALAIGEGRLQMLSAFFAGLVVDYAIHGAEYDPEDIRASVKALMS